MQQERWPARVVTADNCPTYRVATQLVRFKALSTDTGGAYSLFETSTEPGEGMLECALRYEDEAFLVLEGTYLLRVNDEEVTLQAGDYAFVPRGTFHGFTNPGTTPARMLILTSPGGILERFLTEAGEFIAAGMSPSVTSTPDLPHLLMIAAKYGVEILLPPSNVEG